MIVAQDEPGEEVVANEDWSTLPRFSRAGRLTELLVELLVCGGISCWMEEEIRRNGIRMIPWVAGDVRAVLAALREGTISDPCYAMPGRIGCTRRRLGHGNRGRTRVQELFRKGV